MSTHSRPRRTPLLFLLLLLPALTALSGLGLGCNAFSGIDEFEVQPAGDGRQLDDADRDAGDGGPPLESGGDSPNADVDRDALGLEVSEIGSDSVPDAIDVDSGPARRRIFTTSETYTPDLGGLAGADAKCQTLADAAKLGGVYRAWLSDSKTSAKSRLSHATVPYVLVDGTVVASDWLDLTSGALAHAIDMTEKGTKPPDGKSWEGPRLVWTATEPSGAFHDLVFTGSTDSTCQDWTLSKVEADDAGTLAVSTYGRWDLTGAKWTVYSDSGETCRTPTTLALYCLEQ